MNIVVVYLQLAAAYMLWQCSLEMNYTTCIKWGYRLRCVRMVYKEHSFMSCACWGPFLSWVLWLFTVLPIFIKSVMVSPIDRQSRVLQKLWFYYRYYLAISKGCNVHNFLVTLRAPSQLCNIRRKVVMLYAIPLAFNAGHCLKSSISVPWFIRQFVTFIIPR